MKVILKICLLLFVFTLWAGCILEGDTYSWCIAWMFFRFFFNVKRSLNGNGRAEKIMWGQPCVALPTVKQVCVTGLLMDDAWESCERLLRSRAGIRAPQMASSSRLGGGGLLEMAWLPPSKAAASHTAWQVAFQPFVKLITSKETVHGIHLWGFLRRGLSWSPPGETKITNSSEKAPLHSWM